MFPNINSKKWYKSSGGVERILVQASGCLDAAFDKEERFRNDEHYAG